MDAKQIKMKFKAHALKKGYIEKIVGDDAYSKSRRPQSPFIRLISAKFGHIIVYETGKGRYEI